ncbi:hypothetical protein TNCV_3915741 [Trichonephila clavipes]|nr:hypothetical protein TNCV_3915741 [Trichonephila clavipes]
MVLYRSPLTVTLWPSSFLKKYGPMIPPAHKAHQTVSFSGSQFIGADGCRTFWYGHRAGRPRQQLGQASGGILPKRHVRWLGESEQQPGLYPGASRYYPQWPGSPMAVKGSRFFGS